MIDQRQYDRWQNRWQGLSESIQAKIKEVAGDGAKILKRPTIIPSMTPTEKLAAREAELEKVKIFAATEIGDSSETQKDKHFKAAIYLSLNLLLRYTDERVNYFADGFFNQVGTHKLEQSIELPPAYVLQRTLFLASRDFSTLTKIYGQRQNGVWQKHLDAADYLAGLALDPAIEANLVPQAKIITYFQKETSIKIIPYASLALIGIPYTSLHNPADLMSIPHEVGHHVYVNGHYEENGAKKILSQELAYQVSEYPYWIRQWTEEIFADVYGAIIAGPVAALTAQTLIDEKSPAERVKDDGEHPVDMVRPLVYQYILKKINEMSLEVDAPDIANPDLEQQVIHALEARWKRINFGLPKQFRPADGPLGMNEQPPNEYIKEADAARKLRQLINESDKIPLLRDLLEVGDNKRKAEKQSADADRDSIDPETVFRFGNWGNVEAANDPAQDPEAMFTSFSQLFNRKFSGSLSIAIQDEVDEQKEGTLQFDIIRKNGNEPYSTHILYSLKHDLNIQIPAGVWRLLGDDWGEKGPDTLTGGGGSYP